jgi:hypothetical protein
LPFKCNLQRYTLERLSLFHLRDCTRPTLEPVIDAVGLCTLNQVDP